MRLTPAQSRLVAIIRAHKQDSRPAEYWPVVNDWIKDGAGPELGFRNQDRCVNALIRKGVIRIDDDGYFVIVGEQE